MDKVVLEPFNIQLGNELTWNVQPLLHEIRHAIHALLDSGQSSVIDLRSIPLAPGEEEALLGKLGCGEVHAKLNALGPSEIYETQYPGVWLVTHFNAENSVIGRFIEITTIPEILKSQQQDLHDSLARLETLLLPDADAGTSETRREVN